jgi:ABC-type sugar transport system substrate-binding protein
MGGKARSFLVLLVALTALFAVGCGSSDDNSSSGDTGSSNASSGSGGSGGADVATAEAAVKKYSQTTGVKWPQPTEAFDPGKGRIAVISCGNAGINCKQGAEDAVTATKAMGWTPSPVFDGEFTPAKQAGFVQQAVQEKYDGIVLVSIDANSIKAAIDAAAAAKIPITCVMCVNPGFEGKVVDVTSGGKLEGDALGNWIVADSKGKAKVLAYDDKSFPIVAVRQNAAKEAITKLCPDCTFKLDQFPTTDLTKPGPPTWTAALAANPPGSITDVMAAYDPAAIPMTKTAEQRGRTDFKMTGYDASPDYVALIKAGGVAAATTAAPFPYCSWGAVDQIARMKAGKQTWDSSALPIALVTKDNADQFTGAFFSPPDFDFKAMFMKQWGKA